MAAENSPGTGRCSRRTYNESIDELAVFEKSAKNRVDMMAVIDTEADDTHVDAVDMHGATLAVDAETNRFELSQYAFLADLDADSFVAMIERFAASLVDMREKIEGAKVLKLFAPRSKR